MSKLIKLPTDLKEWKVKSLVGEKGGTTIYKAEKKSDDGSIIKAQLRHVVARNDNYNDDNVAYLEEEADFISSVKELGNISNYIDVYVNDNPSKSCCDLYIFTDDLASLDSIMNTKQFTENEIVDFGIQLSSILETLETKKIFHGNISPENIFVTDDGKYKLGGFTDFESKIENTSFLAPEIYRRDNADYTTDIYSVGIIMYAMSNGGKIPFENENTDRKTASEERLSGKAIPAPSDGDEKLKSVIVIACQPENTNRWKNAGNIKNALTSIKDELGTNAPSSAPAVVVPEKTDFDGNVFEEYSYDEFEDEESTENANTIDETPQTEQNSVSENEFDNTDSDNNTPEESTEESENNVQLDETSADDSGFEVVDVTDVEDDNNNDDTVELKPESNNISSDSNSISTFDLPAVDSAKSENSSENTVPEKILPTVTNVDVFDDYSVDHKNNLTSSTKDYGDYFEDEPSSSESVKPSTDKNISSAESNEIDYSKTDFDDNKFEDDDNQFGYDDENEEPTDKKKKNKFVIVLCAVVIAAALGFIGYCVYNGLSSNANNNKSTTASSTVTQAVTKESTQPATTIAPTTEQVTTEEPTLAPSSNNVVPVVGYGYSYGKKLLEQAGFTVEISDYEYSYDYPEGYIISQTPEGDTTADTGTVVQLVISSGLIERETSAPETQAPQQQNSQASESSSSQTNNNNNNSASSSESKASRTSSNSSSSNSSNGDFIFPNSDSSYLSNAQVSALSDNDLQLAINEIYARRGRIFKDNTLNSYFTSKPWYEGKYTADEFEKNVNFNYYEQKNLQLLINERRSRR